jgi:hypothetical protein
LVKTRQDKRYQDQASAWSCPNRLGLLRTLGNMPKRKGKLGKSRHDQTRNLKGRFLAATNHKAGSSTTNQSSGSNYTDSRRFRTGPSEQSNPGNPRSETEEIKPEPPRPIDNRTTQDQNLITPFADALTLTPIRVKKIRPSLSPKKSPYRYSRRGIPYRQGYLFSGPPGTGWACTSRACISWVCTSWA